MEPVLKWEMGIGLGFQIIAAINLYGTSDYIFVFGPKVGKSEDFLLQLISMGLLI